MDTNPGRLPTISIPLPRVTNRVPLEIFETILAQLHGSQNDLLAACLVCKAWIPSCRHHLFAEVRLSATNIQRFFAIQPSIKSHVRKVILEDPAHGEINYLQRFARDFVMPHPIAAFTEGIIACHLTDLNFQSIHFSSFCVLANLIDYIPFIEDLCLDSISWEALFCRGYQEYSRRNQKPSSLRKLHINYCHSRVVINWLLYGIISDKTLENIEGFSRRQFPSLNVVKLPDILPQEADLLGRITFTLRESLTSLEIGYSGAAAFQYGIDNSVSFARNTRLTTIDIKHITLYQFPSFSSIGATSAVDHGDRSLYSWIPDVLSTLPLSVMPRTIIFHIWVSAEEQLDSFPWSDFNAVVSESAAWNLKFCISGVGSGIDELSSWINKRLKLDGGLITVSFELN